MTCAGGRVDKRGVWGQRRVDWATQHRPARCGHRQGTTPAIRECRGAGIDPAILAPGRSSVGDPSAAIDAWWPGRGLGLGRPGPLGPQGRFGPCCGEAVLQGRRCCVSEPQGPSDSRGIFAVG